MKRAFTNRLVQVIYVQCKQGRYFLTLRISNYGSIAWVLPADKSEISYMHLYWNQVILVYQKECMVHCVKCLRQISEQEHTKLFSYSDNRCHQQGINKVTWGSISYSHETFVFCLSKSCQSTKDSEFHAFAHCTLFNFKISEISAENKGLHVFLTMNWKIPPKESVAVRSTGKRGTELPQSHF